MDYMNYMLYNRHFICSVNLWSEIRAFKQVTSEEIMQAFIECVANSFGNSFEAARELVDLLFILFIAAKWLD